MENISIKKLNWPVDVSGLGISPNKSPNHLKLGVRSRICSHSSMLQNGHLKSNKLMEIIGK